MTGILNALIAGVSGAVKDTYFNLVSLLLPGNGTNGAQNNTFLDSGTANSGSGFTITRNGNTTQGTFSPFSQTGWGNYFNGGGSGFLNAVTDTAFAFGTGDFTLEAYLYCTSYPSAGTVRANIISAHNWNGSGFNFTFRLNQTGYLEFEISSVVTSSSIVPLNTWTHVACVRSSGTITFYINGVASGSGAQSNSLASTTPISIGAALSGGTYGNYTGYISNARIVKGVVVYTGNFTPPIVPLAATQSAGTNISAITGTQTSLLTCQNNRFKDNSTYNFALTNGSGASVTPFSPFAPTQSYSASAVGGSGYFDGTGDYLAVADNAAFDFGSGDFTVEAWVYCTAADFASSRYIVAQRNASADTSISFAMNFIGGGFRKVRLLCFDSGGSMYEAVCATDVLNLNEWTHIAGVRNGATLRIYVNGVQQGTANISTASLVDSDGSVAIGRLGDANAAYWLGYISGLRITKGGCLYPSGTTFTPPTTPPTTTVSSGTVSLLTNFTNAGVVDATAKNVLETVGNAQISTTQSKWGGGSISFDGTSNTGLKAPTGNLFTFGSGAFTIEFWVRFNSVAADQMVLNLTGTTIVLAFYVSATGTLSYYLSSDGSTWNIVSGALVGSISTGQWYRVALVRSGNTFTPYLNTTAGTPTTSSAALATPGSGTFLHLGMSNVSASNLSGYLDDVRVTRGVARDMTVLPTAPFPVQ